ncbi:MAG: type 4a pilus biogenesis protein PilO [Syntrophaceae bacterium]|nr:type 4a pilus biogenesis protein PilO [Syntrophaceae bacterium]
MAIDLNTIKKMPLKMKIVVIFLGFLLISYLYYFSFLNSSLNKKSSLTTKLSEMQDKIKQQEKIANQLKSYMDSVKALQANYKIALQKLPNQREIPNLFHSVAEAGKDAGIDFVLFAPQASTPKGVDKPPPATPKAAALLKPSDQRGQAPAQPAGGRKAAAAPPEPFYEEIPVQVAVVGTYQNILYFFDKVAKLPRIVNISNISIGDRKELKDKDHFVLTASFTIKTYMFIDKK